jgi:chaperone required for assembly of F1-ATPase
MSGWKAKRFWKEATISEVEGGYRVELDGRPVRTPAKALMVVPTKAIAEAIAAEWDAQTEEVKPESMPITRSANAALDKVSIQFDEVADMLSAYGGSDLLCYRADSPVELTKRQSDEWDPILDWAEGRFGTRLVCGFGVMPVTQSDENLRVLRDHFEIAAFHDLVGISGSLILALAVTEGYLTAEDAWLKSRVDELWQEEQWGQDDEATELAMHKQGEFLMASRIYQMLQT